MRVGGYLPMAAQVMPLFGVTDPNKLEVLNQSLYDSGAYAAAGMNTMTFFLTPQGAGTGFGGGAKNLSDTNMVLSGQLSQNTAQLVTSISVEFQPTTPTVAADMPAAGAVVDKTSVLVNDVYIFRRSGNLIFKVYAKNYLEEAPLMNFGPNNRFRIDAALCTNLTTGAATQSRIAFADVDNGPRDLNPGPILLGPNTNFQVSLNWPEGLQAITNPARVFVRLNGLTYRMAQ